MLEIELDIVLIERIEIRILAISLGAPSELYFRARTARGFSILVILHFSLRRGSYSSYRFAMAESKTNIAPKETYSVTPTWIKVWFVLSTLITSWDAGKFLASQASQEMKLNNFEFR